MSRGRMWIAIIWVLLTAPLCIFEIVKPGDLIATLLIVGTGLALISLAID